MAGETSKTTRLTNRENRILPAARLADGSPREARDTESIATAEAEGTDVILFDLHVPSNALHTDILLYNDTLDSVTDLVIDIGLYAAEAFTSTTGTTDTVHAADDVLDADLLVDGSVELQTANTNWVSVTPDSATYGPEDASKPYWELLGYANDPNTLFRIGILIATVAATPVAGDVSMRVRYVID